MDLFFAIKIIIELAAMFGIICMILNEEKLIEFERELYVVLRQFVRKKLRKNN